MAKGFGGRMPGMGGGMNMNMLKQAQKMQQDMMRMQQELQEKEYQAAAGGGVVSATVNGKHELKNLVIDPEAVDPEDVEMLQDLVVSAVNEALRQANDAMENSMNGVTGENLMVLLESRLDNVVFRLGFARTRREARQTVSHGHFTVNGRRVDIPSYLVKPGDVIAVGEKYRDLLPIKEALIQSERFEVPGWLEVDIEKLSGNVLSLPTREQISTDIQEQLIVELYSK